MLLGISTFVWGKHLGRSNQVSHMRFCMCRVSSLKTYSEASLL